jgi:hypothetical protein
VREAQIAEAIHASIKDYTIGCTNVHKNRSKVYNLQINWQVKFLQLSAKDCILCLRVTSLGTLSLTTSYCFNSVSLIPTLLTIGGTYAIIGNDQKQESGESQSVG